MGGGGGGGLMRGGAGGGRLLAAAEVEGMDDETGVDFVRAGPVCFMAVEDGRGCTAGFCTPGFFYARVIGVGGRHDGKNIHLVHPL